MTPQEIREQLQQAVGNDSLVDSLVFKIGEIDKLAAQVGAAALDPNLFAEGGQAFLWEDLLSLQDVTRLLGNLANLTDIKSHAEILLKLVLFWRKLRGVRVGLDRDEYLVMKAVKGRTNSVEQIAKALGKSAEEIRPVVDRLKAKKYQGDITLLEEKDGVLSTKF